MQSDDILIRAKPLAIYMAKRKGRRRATSRFQALPINLLVAPGTLAAGTVQSSEMTSLGVTRFRVVSTRLTITMSDHTPTEGPLIFGIANGDLTNAEVGEALDASPTSMADIVARERARRPVRQMGVFLGNAASEVTNDGKPINQKLVTVLDTGVELNFWVRNEDGSALTTGTLINIHGKVFGYWI